MKVLVKLLNSDDKTKLYSNKINLYINKLQNYIKYKEEE